ncbi:hypothetical protein JQC91_10685 [Jannaschia sp. Os4]|uniref:hypothetical protein n=1 Tax=Jannaschia sp. Os4 TaxID=2807617 RepID=UPI0019393620|nr:hypothetical protein [Jannaschia sp. Os4]MBM2576770.1 hypothetical protein [Jannaschia sp. Os4]
MSAKSEREARLKRALKANMGRRKAQARERADEDTRAETRDDSEDGHGQHRGAAER